MADVVAEPSQQTKVITLPDITYMMNSHVLILLQIYFLFMPLLAAFTASPSYIPLLKDSDICIYDSHPFHTKVGKCRRIGMTITAYILFSSPSREYTAGRLP